MVGLVDLLRVRSGKGLKESPSITASLCLSCATFWCDVRRCFMVASQQANAQCYRRYIYHISFTKLFSYRLHAGGKYCLVKAAFHYSSHDQVCSQVFNKFVRVCDTLSTSIRLFL